MLLTSDGGILALTFSLATARWVQRDRSGGFKVIHVTGIDQEILEVTPGFEPGVEVLQD